ncbi:MAG: hypothetical protein AAGB51_05670 [Planctomycetota bacterium]
MTTDRDPNLNLAALLRAAADDELTAEQRVRLDAHLAAHPEDADRVAFERELRQAVSRVIADATPSVSDRLRERVRAIAAEARGEDSQAVSGVESLAAETSQPSFWANPLHSPLGRGIGSLAALIALAAVLWFVPAPVVTPAYAQAVAQHVSSEHSRCALLDDAVNAKFSVNSLEEVPAAFRSITGRDVSLASLALADFEGMTFVDAGRCRVPPSTESSLHVRFRTDAGELISLFVQPAASDLGMEEGVTYQYTGHAPKDGSACATVIGWTKSGFVYYLVSDRSAPCANVLKSVGQPMPQRTI